MKVRQSFGMPFQQLMKVDDCVDPKGRREKLISGGTQDMFRM